MEMRWLSQWKRRPDGWVERKRRFQKMFAKKMQNVTVQEALLVAREKLPPTMAPVEEQ
jgi:hypothetical protein